MPKIVIIADDLTGANATCVLLSREGYEAATFLETNNCEQEYCDDFDIISITTDSRALAKEDAYKRVSDIVNFYKNKDLKFFSKRIDSTLRGNIGTEIDAVLDNIENDSVAIVVSSFPSSGRITIGGYLMVNSIPLQETDVAKDPKTPVHTSFVPKLLEEQTKYSVGFIPLGNILKGVTWLKEEILKSYNEGNRVIMIDATTNRDIELIAKAVKMIELNVVAVDPGPFTAYLTKEYMGEPNVVPGQKVMLAVGSVTNLTRKQLNELDLTHSPLFVEVNAKSLIYENTHKAEVERVVNNVLNRMEDYKVIVTMTTAQEQDVLNLSDIAKELSTTEDEVSQRISNGLSEIVLKTLEASDSSIGGLFTSGGDVTVSVCNALLASGVRVKDEIIPLAVYGKLIGGSYDDMPIVTKGGLIGDNYAITKCVDYLLTKVSNNLHQNKK